jgi:SAM-dependent methyltransferase
VTPEPACPLCAAELWTVVGERTFQRHSLGSSSEGVRDRLRVLFELWAPSEAAVRIEYVLCQRCAFVTYRPRPTEAEVDAKYRFLHELAAPRDAPSAPSRIERRRSLELFRALRPHLLEGRARVLDFGGYRGALMTEIAGLGCECCVVDYAPDVLPGLTRLGDTLADLDGEQRFDVIVCSHVLEHVVQPLETCRQLVARLRIGGLLFVEVPLEILGHAPRQREPVTHLNFFSKESLDALLRLAGLQVESCQATACTVGDGRQRLVVRALARRSVGATDAVRFEERAASVQGLMRVSRHERWLWALRHPRLLLDLPLRVKSRVSGLRRRVVSLLGSSQQ